MTGFLAALQLADSALPIGRFVHSQGLEAWIRAADRGERETVEWVRTATTLSAAPLDGVAVAHAHDADSPGELLAIDAWLTARRLTPSARRASEACGRQLAALGLTGDDALSSALADAIRAEKTPGNAAVVLGTVARAVGVGRREAVLIELRGTASSLLSAAVRLGALAPARAQHLLASLHPAIERAADEAATMPLDEAYACAPQLEVFAMAHARLSGRLFAT